MTFLCVVSVIVTCACCMCGVCAFCVVFSVCVGVECVNVLFSF